MDTGGQAVKRKLDDQLSEDKEAPKCSKEDGDVCVKPPLADPLPSTSFNDIPHEILLLIFKYLNTKEICQMSR